MHLNPAIAALLQALNHPALPSIELSLGRMQALLAALGNPQLRVPPVIHVAGTNGKGSTIAFLRALLEANGQRVHGYTSPHLVAFNERIVLAGLEITDAQLLPLLQRVYDAAKEQPVTLFEATTTVAFLAFAQYKADFLLLEVGLGGRLDATNVVMPVATVITPIALDHQEFLGGQIDRIAQEKAGILKAGVPCITAPQSPEALAVIEKHAAALSAPMHYAPGTLPHHRLGLAGLHQQGNAALAVATLEALQLPVHVSALAQAQWPGRLQRLTRGPLVEAWGAPIWLDGAHNAHAAHALAQWIREQPQPVCLIVGLMARKDAGAFFTALRDCTLPMVTVPIPGHEDAYPPDRLAHEAQAAGVQVTSAPSLGQAVLELKRYQPATLVVAGSLYLVGELLKTHE